MYKKIVLAATLVVLPTVSVCAGPSNTQEIETVLVTATRFEGPAMPVASNITVIDKQQIRASGAIAVIDVLRSQPGIQLKQVGGSDRNTTISMRGFASNASSNVLILVDGRKLNNPTLASPALNSIALKDIERIEIVHGSAGVLYGDQAVAGVINVITNRTLSRELSGYLEASSGSDGYERYSASLEQSFDNGLAYHLSVDEKHTDNYRDNNSNDYENYLFNLNYQFERGSIFVEAQKINDNLQLPGAISESLEKYDRRATKNPNDFSDQDTDLLRLGGDFQLHDKWKFAMDYAWRDENAKSYGYGFPDPNQSTRVKNMSPRLIGQLNESGTALLTLGYDRSDSDYKVREWGLDAEQTVDALYAQLIWPLSASLTATIGGRNSDFEERNHIRDEKQTDRAEAYEAGLVFNLSNEIDLFTRYAQAFRYATLDENGGTLPAIDFLKPQTSDSIEFGAQLNYGDIETRISLYKMNIDDEIAYDAEIFNPNGFNVCGGQRCGANINLPESERRGGVLESSYELNADFILRGSYTYTDAEQKSGSFKGNEVDFVARHMATLALQHNWDYGISSYIETVYTGRRYRASDFENSRGKLASYTLVNLNLIWDYQSWHTNIRVDNLLDKEYSGYSIYSSSREDDFVYPQADRTVTASVSYTF